MPPFAAAGTTDPATGIVAAVGGRRRVKSRFAGNISFGNITGFCV
ncbi:MAG TPA: hypothetical protein VMV72_04600 [Verrucomicrobiae bacterium]|nr:hypothetical protein [Verrucomicrobiae bacterium]